MIHVLCKTEKDDVKYCATQSGMPFKIHVYFQFYPKQVTEIVSSKTLDKGETVTKALAAFHCNDLFEY